MCSVQVHSFHGALYQRCNLNEDSRWELTAFQSYRNTVPRVVPQRHHMDVPLATSKYEIATPTIFNVNDPLHWV